VKPRVVIIGCGKLGRKLAVAAAARGYDVMATVRTSDSQSLCAQHRIPARLLDLDHSCAAAELDFRGAHVFYLVPPVSTGTEDRRVHRFLELLSADGLPASVVLLSVTGVYGDCAGAWVTEETPVKPMTDRARRRVYVEQAFRSWLERHRTGYCILRVAGIYGPGRLPLARIRARKPVLDPSEAGFSNRIHEQDLLDVCLALLEKTSLNTVLNVADDAPSTMTDYFFQIADRLQLPRPPVLSRRQAETVLSAGMLSYLSESRRVSNRRMKQLLGLKLRYPSLAHGLTAIDCKPVGRLYR